MLLICVNNYWVTDLWGFLLFAMLKSTPHITSQNTVIWLERRILFSSSKKVDLVCRQTPSRSLRACMGGWGRLYRLGCSSTTPTTGTKCIHMCSVMRLLLSIRTAFLLLMIVSALVPLFWSSFVNLKNHREDDHISCE